MNKVKLAEELVKLAKELTAGNVEDVVFGVDNSREKILLNVTVLGYIGRTSPKKYIKFIETGFDDVISDIKKSTGAKKVTLHNSGITMWDGTDATIGATVATRMNTGLVATGFKIGIDNAIEELKKMGYKFIGDMSIK